MEKQKLVARNRRSMRALMVALVLGVGADFRVFAETPAPCASTASGDIEIVPFENTVFWE
jgi:hypothetical protein